MCCTDEDVDMSQSPDVVREGDQLSISCAVNYSGLLAPGFIWKPNADNTPLVVDTGSSVKSTVQVTVPPVRLYTCYVSFSGSVFPPSANRTSARVKSE